ncbi:uncharacterized protein LOC114539446 [Dendronephthya gigantea]|uniref:uncharacterized protein LOC114539446 n=1 Tax=Dendronephthya gigantea TaxID=151771 RepID=UPI00106A10C3|nr:uncharacterized protein LOC114539446 [Dendronephthya gigantea]
MGLIEDSDDSDDDLETILLSTLMPTTVKRCRLNLNDISEDDCETMFRFRKEDMKRLSEALLLPEYYRCHQRTMSTSMEALMILLRRLAYPNRWCDLSGIFGRPEPEMSLIFNEIVNDLYNRFSFLLTQLNLAWLDPQIFCDAIHARGAPLRNCWGFIDGTARPICRPIFSQRIMFSGHKRTHCIKFQSVVTPNGLICNLFGPIEGRRHDAFMLTASGLLEQLQLHMNNENGEPFVLYGDPAYPVRSHLLAPFRGAQLSPTQQQFNRHMSSVRTSVEWGFGKIVQYFAFMDFSKNLKVLLQPVGKLYCVAVLLTNCHTCLYGSQTGHFFGVDPPQLEAYLRNM